MARYHKKNVVLVTALVLITLLFAALLTSTEANQDPNYFNQEEISIRAELLAAEDRLKAENGGFVEILILLDDQADTLKVARETRKNHALSGASARDTKMAVRFAVIDALAEKASRSQAPLIAYLEQKKMTGEVEEYKSYFIVNLLYARLSENLLDEIANFPEVDLIKENEYFKLEEPIPAHGLNSNSATEWNIEKVKAPKAWSAGLNGSGIVVGIIDTGVDWQHDALRGQYRGFNSASPDNADHSYNWFDPHYEKPFPDDFHGHGSHVAGIVLGLDRAEDYTIGVAPGAKWIAARAFNEQGITSEEYLIAAGQFMLAPTPNPDGSGMADPSLAPDIINNSWGSRRAGEFNEWYLPMIQSWRSAGILPVFAAGNSGPGSATISHPGNYPESLAVAAVNIDNNLASWSSRGPAPYSSPDDLKPNISAPGVTIRSVQSWSPSRERGYKYLSGTSMAAPHVAGVAALVMQSRPHLTVDQVEALICDTAFPLVSPTYPHAPNYGFGHGLADAYAAATGWVSFSQLPAAAFAYGDITGDGEANLVASYPSGTWCLDGGSWVRLTPSAARSLTFADMSSDGNAELVASFSSGTWYLSGDEWSQITPVPAAALAYGDITGDGEANLVASYPSGTWYLDHGSWVKLTPSAARSLTFVDMSDDGNAELVASFSSGTWYLSGDEWSQITPVPAAALAFGDMTGDGDANLASSFPSGTWYLDHGSWVRLTPSTTRSMIFAGMTGKGDLSFVAAYRTGSWYRIIGY